MKKLSVFLLGLSLATLLLGACSSQPAVYTDEKQPVTVGVGQQFNVVLDSNPTTGYGWTATIDAKFLTQVAKNYAAPTTTLVGAGGQDTFTFQGVAAGTTDLVFKYARSFDPPTTAPAQTKTFKVTVK